MSTRASLLSFIATDPDRLTPTQTQLVNALNTDEVGGGGLLVDPVDIGSFVGQVEGYVTALEFLKKYRGDITSLDDVLSTLDPDYFAQYQSDMADLDAQFQAVVESVDYHDDLSGLGTLLGYSALSEWNNLWVSAASVGGTLYSMVRAASDGFTDAGEALYDAMAQGKQSMQLAVSANVAAIGMAGAAELEWVENLYDSLIDTGQAAARVAGAAFGGDVRSSFGAAYTAFASAMSVTNSLLAAGSDAYAMLRQRAATNDTAAKVVGLIDAILSVAPAYAVLNDIRAAMDSDTFSPVSVNFLEDAFVSKAWAAAGTANDVVMAFAAFLPTDGLGPAFNVGLEAFKGAYSSVFAIAEQTSFGTGFDNWYLERDRYETLQNVIPLIAEYQQLISSALSHADQANGAPVLGDVGTTVPDNQAQYFYSSEEDSSFQGSAFNDTAFGHDGVNIFFGRAGADFLYGENGRDFLIGGAGDDFLYDTGGSGLASGGAGNDYIQIDGTAMRATGGSGYDRFSGSYQSATASIIVNQTEGRIQTGGNDIASGFESFYLWLGSGNDTFKGGIVEVMDGATRHLSVTDMVDAGGGNDHLVLLHRGSDSAGVSIVGLSTFYATGALQSRVTMSDGSERYAEYWNFETGVHYGTAFDDELSGMAGRDTILGGAGNDYIAGLAGDDLMVGAAGNDHIVMDRISDRAHGGSGYDRLDANLGATATAAIHVNLPVGTVSHGSDQIASGFEAASLTLGAGNDIFNGGFLDFNGEFLNLAPDWPGWNESSGGAGSDRLILDFSGTSPLGNTARAVDVSARGASELWITVTHPYGAEDIHCFLDFESIQISGSNGNDQLIGLSGADTLIGGLGDDLLSGEGGADLLVAGEGNDLVTVDTVQDRVFAGAGIDWLQGTYADATQALRVDLGAGRITQGATNIAVGFETAKLMLGRGNDTLDASVLRDYSDGNYHWVSGGAGADHLILDFSRTANGAVAAPSVMMSTSYWDDPANGVAGDLLEVQVALQDRSPLSLSVLNFDSVNVTGSQYSDSLVGTKGNDTLRGGGGADSLEGGAGHDLIDGGMGNDTMSGGAGDDTYHVTSSHDEIFEGAGQGKDLVLAQASFALREGLEDLTLTGSAKSGYGNTQANRITGNAHDNTLDGKGGADTLIGAGGSDIYVTDGRDVIVETAGGGLDLVQSSATSYVLGANLERLELIAFAQNGTGNTLANRITGNDHRNRLDGGGGADTLIGRDGDDIYITDGGDLITELANDGYDIVQSKVTHMLGNNLEALHLTGAGAIDGTGNALDNRIFGNDVRNRLDGGLGNDLIAGGQGADTIIGGEGRDTMNGGFDTMRDVFLFRTIAESRLGNVDVVRGFLSGHDDIDLAAIDANWNVAGNQGFGFGGKLAKAYGLWFVDTGADLVLRGDVTGDTSADFEIRLTDINNLAAGDFVL